MPETNRPEFQLNNKWNSNFFRAMISLVPKKSSGLYEIHDGVSIVRGG